MGLGYLQGSRPQSFERSNFIAPAKIRILTTEEELIPQELRKKIEKEKNVLLEVIVNKTWQDWLANIIADPSADLLILPSYWAHGLYQQNLLDYFPREASEILSRVSPDFAKPHLDGRLSFYPVYWMKTTFTSPLEQSFAAFSKDSKQEALYLWSDPDLLLAHFRIWRSQKYWDLIKKKKILILPFTDLQKISQGSSAVVETALHENMKSLTGSELSSLLVWGISIPKNANRKSLSLEMVEALTRRPYQEELIFQSPFSSALKDVGDKTLPISKKAAYIRDLNLKDTIILDSKDVEAEKHLIEEFDFTY